MSRRAAYTQRVHAQSRARAVLWRFAVKCYSDITVKKHREGAPEGAEEPQKEPAAESGSASPQEQTAHAESASGTPSAQAPRRSRRRTSRKSGTASPSSVPELPFTDGTLDGEASSTDVAPAEGAALEGAAPEGASATPKSRSKRRRERRKEAKARGDTQRDRLSDTQPSEPMPRKKAQAAVKGKKAQAPRREQSGSAQREAPAQESHEDRRARKAAERRAERQLTGIHAAPRASRPAQPRNRHPFDTAAGLAPGFRGPRGERYDLCTRREPPVAQEPAVRVLEALTPSRESMATLERLAAVIDEASPLSPKHRAGLKGDIRELWEELTSEREHRSADYLGTPPALSAYIRYFMPWNVFRLSAIFSNADFCLPDNAVVVDIGSGPLTLPIALYASRPELREVPLTIYCLDRVERILEAGKTIFETLCLRTEGRLPPWRIELKKEGFGGPLPERAHLLSAANVFNEFFWKDKRPLGERAIETARILLTYLRENGSLFVMEPGDPRSGAFIAALRAALIAEGASPLGPCPHALACPMPGIFRHLLPPEATRVTKGDPNAAPSRFVLQPVVMPKKRDKFPWCHFGVDAERAPAWLKALSAEAGLPKERAVLSYLWAARGAAQRNPSLVPEPLHASDKERRARANRGILVRVVSEPFALPEGASGQYACSSLGYTLLRRAREDAAFNPGDLLEVAASPSIKNDEKSGAVVLPT